MPPLLPALRNRAMRFVAALLLISLGARGAEPPVREGLVLWLDVEAQPTARQAAALPPTGNRRPVDLLLDSSTHARHAVQIASERRPLFIADDGAAYLEFDGKDDFVSLTGARQLAPAVTIFVLAAPKANAGRFSALLATAESGKNDYTSGLNLDFGSEKTAELSVVNFESAGASGARDLLTDDKFGAAERPFGDFHVFTVRSRIAKNGTEFFLDGFKSGTRDRLESNIGLDQMVIGARYCSNDPAQPPFAQGFFDGALAEVLVYDRALSDAERRRVEEALLAKTVRLHALQRGAKGHALETVPDSPLVQMLVPGFTIQELPVKVGNLNNVRYRHDGKVVGLGYDGRIHILSDTDGDGLEDKAELFWDQKTMRGPIGVALTTQGGDGVIAGSKGKVSLFLDADRDGRADGEKVIATGWKEGFQGVDTVGLAIDPKDGSIVFGLGCANFADAYLIDKATGRAKYDIGSHHGTIQRLSADFSRRETICTGVRFTCALAFNRLGDLFASEQEGATWLPNGNPFDELLHIQRGKHYGFPPRHPQHLPNVIDEPAVFEYGPQHQSTVGMVFNESVNGGPHFGPAQWAGDAIVCGEARGKLYRTKLAKTPLGYVAQNHLIACLGLLLVDACVTPQGDLLVACHSGPPDWGTGPAGEGRLFKIRYTGKALPQPVLAWAAAPDEFRVAFDRPLAVADWAAAEDKVKIEAGRFVSAGDRFETVRPGYQAVRDQMATPRRWVDVLGVSLSADQHTLVLRVPLQSEPVSYAISLPLPVSWKQDGGLAQHPQIDVQASLNGIVVEARSADRELRAVLPHPSLAVAKAFTAGSAEHDAFLAFAATPGVKLTFRGGVDPANPFVPTVQPGAKLDWDMAGDDFASALFSVRVGKVDAPFDAAAPGRIKPLAPITTVAANFASARGELQTALSPQRVFVPWAVDRPAARESAKIVRTDVKGNWLAGRRLYFGEAACFSCHTLRGEGVAFGPDLTNLVHRDRDSVLHDILQPSATINPDQVGSVVVLKDGTNISGIIRTGLGEKVIVALPGGAQVEIARDKVVSIEPLKTSLMLEGYAQRLSAAQREDLLTFLLIDPLQPAPITRTDPAPPPARTRAELAAMLPLPQPRTGAKPIRILLCAGEKDHGIDEHDYPLWLARWSKLLPLADGVTVATCATAFPSDAQLAAADVAVFYSANAGWSPEVAPRLDAFQQRGGGLVHLHWAVGAQGHPEPLAQRIGFAAQIIAFRHGPTELTFTDPAHPITRGFTSLALLDETYWKMRASETPRAAILATAIEDSAPQPQLWTFERGAGRVFGCIPGHYTWTFDDPLYRLLVLRGIAWTARDADPERLSELATIGARIAP